MCNQATTRCAVKHQIQQKARRPLWLVLLMLATVWSGCDVLPFGGGTTVRGVVVDAATGEPLENIWVTLRVSGGRFGSYPSVARDSTDAQGRYYLNDPVRRGSNPSLRANDLSYGEDEQYGAVYNPDYDTFISGVDSNEDHEVQIELEPVSP